MTNPGNPLRDIRSEVVTNASSQWRAELLSCTTPYPGKNKHTNKNLTYKQKPSHTLEKDSHSCDKTKQTKLEKECIKIFIWLTVFQCLLIFRVTTKGPNIIINSIPFHSQSARVWLINSYHACVSLIMIY